MEVGGLAVKPAKSRMNLIRLLNPICLCIVYKCACCAATLRSALHIYGYIYGYISGYIFSCMLHNIMEVTQYRTLGKHKTAILILDYLSYHHASGSKDGGKIWETLAMAKNIFGNLFYKHGGRRQLGELTLGARGSGLPSGGTSTTLT